MTRAMSDAATLAALDFTAPVITCDESSGTCVTPATHRVIFSCGCVALACDRHAQRYGLMQYAAETRGVVLTCTTCEASGVAVIRMELLR